MALNKEQRQAKYAEAERLVRTGAVQSRSELQEKLRAKFGEGIRPAKYSTIYREAKVSRVAQVEKTRPRRVEPGVEEIRPVQRKRYKSRRQGKYDFLRERHFTHQEAAELSRLHRRDYYELRKTKLSKGMLVERMEMWADFDKEAKYNGWSQRTRNKKWAELVDDWYVANNFLPEVVKLGGWKLSNYKDEQHWLEKRVWLWFDSVSKTLPEEYRYTNDQSSLRKKPGRLDKYQKAKRAKENAEKESWIASLMITARNDPSRDEQLTKQAQNLGFKGKSLYQTALTRKRKEAGNG